MKRILATCLLLSLSISCNGAKFGGVEKKKPNNSDVTPETLILLVSTPSDSIKAGQESMQATATLKDKKDVPDVSWTLASDTEDKGSIDEKGNYTSPESAEAEFPVTLIATLKSDPRVSGKKTITVIPVEQAFATCSEGSENFPIVAKVYEMPSSVKRLPDYNNPAEASFKTQVCMENYAIEPRNFEEVKELFEYFSLQTTTTLIAPVDGEYAFQLNSDDGSRLYIDGKEVIDNDGEHQAYSPSPEDSQSEGLKEVVIYLNKGDHALALNYFQGPRFRIGLMLKWKVPGTGDYVYVPRESFK
jgi:PA14 domain